MPSNHNNCKGSGRVRSSKSNSSRMASRLFSRPRNGNAPGWGVVCTCLWPKMVRKGPKKNDLPSPPCFPISATTGRLSWRPWMRHRKTNEHNSAAGTLLSDRSPSAKWRHAPPHTQAREAKARNVSARDIPTTCKVSSTVSQRHTSSIRADRRWRSRKANLNKAGVACAFKCWMRRSAAHGLSGVFLKCRAR